jgi:hypothetical protein
MANPCTRKEIARENPASVRGRFPVPPEFVSGPRREFGRGRSGAPGSGGTRVRTQRPVSAVPPNPRIHKGSRAAVPETARRIPDKGRGRARTGTAESRNCSGTSGARKARARSRPHLRRAPAGAPRPRRDGRPGGRRAPSARSKCPKTLDFLHGLGVPPFRGLGPAGLPGTIPRSRARPGRGPRARLPASFPERFRPRSRPGKGREKRNFSRLPGPFFAAGSAESRTVNGFPEPDPQREIPADMRAT